MQNMSTCLVVKAMLTRSGHPLSVTFGGLVRSVLQQKSRSVQFDHSGCQHAWGYELSMRFRIASMAQCSQRGQW